VISGFSPEGRAGFFGAFRMKALAFKDDGIWVGKV
jgi:hypothetical protein